MDSVKDILYDVIGFSTTSIEDLISAVAEESGDSIENFVASICHALPVSEETAWTLGARMHELRKNQVAVKRRRLTPGMYPPEFRGRGVEGGVEGESDPLGRQKEGESDPLGRQKDGAQLSAIDASVLASTSRDARYKDDPIYITRLREEARREYLRDRELSQLELAKRIVEDREQVGVLPPDLAREVSRRNEEEKQRIRLTEQLRDERAATAAIDVYELPEAYEDDTRSKLKVLKKRLVDQSQSHRMGAATTRLDEWEQQKLREALPRAEGDKETERGSGAERGRTADTLIDESGNLVEFERSEIVRGSLDDDEAWWNMSREEREAVRLQDIADRRRKMEAERRLLPVYKFRAQLLKAIRDNPVVVIVGETGSGKTTQIPQYLHEVGYSRMGMIGCTQPRRVAAMSVAARVADEMEVKLGRDVGYIIRFENMTSDGTKISYLTDGALLQQFLTDPELSQYSVLIIDEAHERSLHTDVLFGLVKDLSRYRSDDFRLIISSATLEAEKFSKYFDDAPIFKIPGRKYDVDIFYTKQPEANFIDAAAATVIQIHTQRPLDGDVLVFLPGQQEIEECMELIQTRLKNEQGEAKKPELRVLPIYSTLPADQQALIFVKTPPTVRKCVLATNIAETSITIDNIVYVVDPGLVKENSYDPRSGLASLVTVPCSRASCNQRAGRAGRVKPGMCFRLFTKTSWLKELEECNAPEMLRCDISQVVLIMKSLGIDDLLNFDFLDPPPTQALIQSLETLYHLGALNDKGQMTSIGRKMSQLPGTPQIAKMILAGGEMNCLEECLTIASMLEVANSLFYCPKQKAAHATSIRRSFQRKDGDHLTLLHVYRSWEQVNYDQQWCFDNFVQFRSLNRARDIYDQFVALLPRVGLAIPNTTSEDLVRIKKAIASAFFMQAAVLTRNGQYKTLVTNRVADIHPSSSLFITQDANQRPAQPLYRPPCVIYGELVLTTKKYLRNVTEIEARWLSELVPHFFKNHKKLLIK
ncbi:RNA helicase [Gregarina niphandrodes]|uniref:RNA helicase n=1 Tax=Gregarina niphandrodes TaxID=110365 RepID=A0A023B7K9_GRENI|nr:RNA helicase [Gregarina niphandrodes]EZG67536.1 RNA helicase [Gregarina niphandrodes]|eukprot:XP_011130213.1 RNA helicase [Gregarina niphandrodes]